MAEQKVTVDVEGKHLTLSNLSKVLYPSSSQFPHGVTKAEVIDYYTRISPVLLPHLAGRPLTVKRYPDGATGHFFFEKNAPSHAPDWVRTVELPVPGSTKDRETIRFVVVEGLATLVWLANLAALELHTPQWRVGPKGGVHPPDQLVIDLDPGAPAAFAECAQVALLARPHLPEGTVAKTSGNKGMQLYSRWPPVTSGGADTPGKGDPSDAAKRLAEKLEAENPGLVVSRMAKNLRGGKIFVDWSQNNAAKTTISVWSLRAREVPAVSAPLTWDEVEAAADGGPVPLITMPEALERNGADGDGFASLLR
jgi:bifunctional non-homologous end joining protein LigD